MTGPRLFLILCLAFLHGCASLSTPPERYLRKYKLISPGKDGFQICVSFGCRDKEDTGFSQVEWQEIRTYFHPGTFTPSEERELIGRAVARMEQIIGPKVGTDLDLGRNRWTEQWNKQLDCIAETVNTTIYLTLLESDGLLFHHRPAHPSHRGFLIFYPHNTAVIMEKKTGQTYTVDSWFHENGHVPVIIPLKDWKAGYQPSL